jgi:hypothetical protein
VADSGEQVPEVMLVEPGDGIAKVDGDAGCQAGG